MKKILPFLFVAAMLCSCNYQSEIRNRDTTLDLQLLDLGGNYAYVQVAPANDYTLYCASVMEVDKYDRYMSLMSEEEFQKLVMDSISVHYYRWRTTWYGNTDKYVADIVEHEYAVSTGTRYFLHLEPQTDYYVYAFCVNSNLSGPLGPIQKKKFTTPQYTPVAKGVDFDFMIYDTEDIFYYYVRPSFKGKVCFDVYFSTVMQDSIYLAEPYLGDIRAYLKDILVAAGPEVDYFLSIDISRYETILDLEEGKDYTIMCCPYLNLGNSPITVRHFTYERGMKTTYDHDEVIE